MKKEIIKLLKNNKLKLLKKCPNSLIYTYKNYLIKNYRGDGYDLRKEFSNQEKIYEIFKRYEDVKIPKPFFYSIKYKILVMEYIKSKTLTEYLRKNNLYFKGESLHKIYYRIGKALNYFHKKIKWKTDVAIEKKMHNLINDVKLEPLYQPYLKLNEFIDDEKIKKQRIHGNFKAQNILIVGKEIYFIDFSYNYLGSSYHDFAKLLESTFTAGFRNKYFPLYNFRRIQLLKNAFLSGYYGSYKKAEKNLLAYYTILLKIHDLTSCKSNKISYKILKKIYEKRIKKIIKSLK